MAKRSKRQQAKPDSGSGRPKGLPRRRDPITTFTRFSNFLSLGLLGAAFYLPFVDGLNYRQTNSPALEHPPITLEQFPAWSTKIAVAICHYPTIWIALCILSMFITLTWFRTRYNPRRSRLVAYGPVAGFLLIGLHAGAMGYLQSSNNGLLRVTFRTVVDVPNLVSPSPASVPASTTAPTASAPSVGPAPTHSSQVTLVSNSLIREGRSDQWTRLFAADMLFMAPILMAWLLSFGMRFLPPVTP